MAATTATDKVQAFPVRQHLIPFLTRVLYRGPAERHQPTRWPLPVGDRDLYTADDLDALRQILPQGLLFAFSRRARGWQRRPLLTGPTPERAQTRALPLWDAAASLQLRFGPQSLQLIEGLYNLCARHSAQSRKSAQHTHKGEVDRLKKLDLSATSDHALLYWLMVGLWPQLDVRAQSDRHEAAAFEALFEHLTAALPMFALRYGPWTAAPLPDQAAFEALMASDARPLLPWWLEHTLAWWQQQESQLWGFDAAHFVAARQRQRALLNAWVGAARKTRWLHLVTPILGYLQLQDRWLTALSRSDRPAAVPSDAWRAVAPGDHPPEPDVVEAALARLHKHFRDLKNQDRQLLREAWAQHLGASALLGELARDHLRVHLADREPYDAFVVQWASTSDLEALTARLHRIARAMEGRLG
jgi:hypothetical protein